MTQALTGGVFDDCALIDRRMIVQMVERAHVDAGVLLDVERVVALARWPRVNA